MRYLEISLILSFDGSNNCPNITKEKIIMDKNNNSLNKSNNSLDKNNNLLNKSKNFSQNETNISQMLKKDHCSSQNSEEKFFYTWVPPHMKELKFNEMKNFGEFIKNKEFSLGFYRKYKEFYFILFYEKGESFSKSEKKQTLNLPPKQKDYIKKSKSQLNLNNLRQNEEISNKFQINFDESVIKPKINKINIKNQEEIEKINELKDELKKTRKCNNEYFKKNQDIEMKFFEITKAYIGLTNCFEKLVDFSKNLHLPNEEKNKIEIIEKFEEEKKKIDSYLKFKSIFSYRFSELLESSSKNVFNDYKKSAQSLIFFLSH